MKLFTKLISLIIVIATVGTIMLGAVFYVSISTALKPEISNNQLDNAKQAGLTIDRFLYDRQSGIQTLAVHPEYIQAAAARDARTATATTAIAAESLSQVRKSSTAWSALYILNNKAALRATTAPDKITSSLRPVGA